MPRKNIYFKDKIDREIESILEIERQKGATPSESSYSSMVNELVRLGLMVYKSREDGESLDLEGFRRDVIRKVTGSREGIMILTAMVTEMYMGHKGLNDLAQLDALISENISAINSAEIAAENQHFVTEK